MPYKIRKQKCKQSDGDAGSYVLSYTTKKGEKRRACHTSKKKAQGQIAAIEGPWEADESEEEVMAERLLREMVREILVEAPLTPAEIDKYGSRRYDIFLQKMKSGESFDLDQKAVDQLGSDFVIIPIKGNSALVSALEDNDRDRLKRAFSAGVSALDADGNSVTLKTSSQLKKSKDFGGRGSGAKGVSANVQNELDFAEHINRWASKTEPITVVIGDYTLRGVTQASQTGSKTVEGQTSKADVVVVSCDGGCKDVGVSIKMDSADYWLSGDRVLADSIGPFVEKLSRASSPKTRLEYDKNAGRYIMMSGDKRIKRIWFDIPSELKDSAVFGTGANTVDIIAKGNFMRSPTWDSNKRLLKWDNATTYKSVSELSDDDAPVGILRTGEAHRGMSYNGTKYTGIRPAIARKGFAAGGNSVEAKIN